MNDQAHHLCTEKPSQVTSDSSLASGLYCGKVTHQRSKPVRHGFTFNMMMFLLNCDEMQEAKKKSPFGPLFKIERFSLFSFHRKDVHRPECPNLKHAVLETVENISGMKCSPTDQVYILTQCRILGFVFNPVSFYYVVDQHQHCKALMAEINNTPWNERHCYVLNAKTAQQESSDTAFQSTFKKNFHVSPFMAMNQTYDWSFSRPSSQIRVNMVNRDETLGSCFKATLELERKPLNSLSLCIEFLKTPFCTLKTVAGIYWHAALLKMKGVPYVEHPTSKTVPTHP